MAERVRPRLNRVPIAASMTIVTKLASWLVGFGVVLGGARIASAAEAGDELRARVDPIVLYLNRDGGRLAAGSDDAPRQRSSVLAARGVEVLDVPAFGSSDAAWRSVVSCVHDQFEDFTVRVVDERPDAGPYVMAMVGGSADMLGLPAGVAGIAPFRGRPMPNAVVFAFEAGHHSARGLCETTAHELGHALGLDHSRLCSDTMSYGSCGPKEFREKAASCGEFSDRACTDGSEAQSSWHLLASHVGAGRPTEVAVVEPSRPRRVARPNASAAPGGNATPRPRSRRDTPATSGGSSVRVAAVDRARGHSVYVVQVQARDADGIRSVELVWEQVDREGRRTRRLQCGQRDAQLPFTCSRRGSVYTFALVVGTGARRFAPRVTDGTGKITMGRTRSVVLF